MADEDVFSDDDINSDLEEEMDEESGSKWFEMDTPLNRYLKNFKEKLKNKDSAISSRLRNGEFMFDPPLASAAFSKRMQYSSELKPDDFYFKKVCVWDVKRIWSHVNPSCYHCCSSDHCTDKGWTSSPRVIYGLKDIYFLFSRVR